MYQVITLNARIIEFEADRVEMEDGVYTFYEDDEVIGEFKRDNIAGYVLCACDDEEEEY
jgi:hypothetical protein